MSYRLHFPTDCRLALPELSECGAGQSLAAEAPSGVPAIQNAVVVCSR